MCVGVSFFFSIKYYYLSKKKKCVDSRMRSKILGVIWKLDIEKAYDNVNWETFLKLLKKMGFGEK